MRKSAIPVYKLTYSALCLAMSFVLPFVTGNIPEFGNMLCPMHFPVLLCGFLCGWQWGLSVGFVAPLMRSLILMRPPLYPTAIAMTFELAAYGLLAGLFYYLLCGRRGRIYIALTGAMLGGRIVGGLMQAILLSVNGDGYTIAVFFTEYFAKAWPGILVQLILIPVVVSALRKAKLNFNERDENHDGKTV